MTYSPTGAAWRARALADLEAELRDLLGEILVGLSDLLDGTGGDSVRRFLADAPANQCVRLADAWALAGELGLDPAQLLPRFTPEEQFLVELVTAIYTAGHPAVRDADPDLYDLCDLVAHLDEPALAGV
jgi:hypothetical protein